VTVTAGGTSGGWVGGGLRARWQGRPGGGGSRGERWRGGAVASERRRLREGMVAGG
jgi:hypothetical protein